MKQNKTKTPDTPQNIYQTGNTDQKKSLRGLFAFLIVAVILLIGVVSVMGLLNIQLFRRVQELDADGYLFRVTSISDPDLPAAPESPRQTPKGVPQLQLQHTLPDADALPQLPPLSLQEIYDNSRSSVVSVIGQKGNGTGVIVFDGEKLLSATE